MWTDRSRLVNFIFEANQQRPSFCTGVSAFTQVISLTVRSKDTTEEMNYVQILNGVLPTSIRCVAWAPVPEGKSARFDCSSRAYRYYFPRSDDRVFAKKIILNNF